MLLSWLDVDWLPTAKTGRGLVFLVREWLAVFVQDAFHHDFDFGAGAFAERPVNGHALLHLGDQLRRDESELGVAHGLHGAGVRGQGVVESLFIIREAHFLAGFGGGVEVLGEFDQLFNDQHRRDGAVVVGVEGLLELLAEDLALHEVALGAHLEFVFEQLFQQLGGDVLVLEAAHFGKELVAQDADVRLGQAGGGEDVDDLALGGDGLAHELADSGVDLLRRLPVGAALLVQRRLQGLEKGNVFADFRRDIAGGAEGKGAGKFGLHLHPALLAVFRFEDVLLAGGDERETFGGFAGGPLVPVEPIHQVAGDAVFLQHQGDGLRGVKGRIALAAALGVRDERFLELIGEAEVVHHQAAGFVAEDAVHAGDGLHESVALHRLVGVHRVQAGRIEAGQPHVAHDHDAERVLGVLEPVRQLAALVLAANVRLPGGAIVGAAGHHHFDDAGFALLGFGFVVFGAGPVGPQFDERVVEVHGDAAAHADDHRLPIHRLHALLEMRHEVGRHQRDAFWIAHQRLQRGPTSS